jgi:hypothetical protein
LGGRGGHDAVVTVRPRSAYGAAAGRRRPRRRGRGCHHLPLLLLGLVNPLLLLGLVNPLLLLGLVNPLLLVVARFLLLLVVPFLAVPESAW